MRSYSELKKTLDLWHSLQKFSSSLTYSPTALAHWLGHIAAAWQQVGFPPYVRHCRELFLALGFPCVALSASQLGREEVTLSLLFCRCLETEFEGRRVSGLLLRCTALCGKTIPRLHQTQSQPGNTCNTKITIPIGQRANIRLLYISFPW